MNDELLIITMEECAELIQACSKLIRFGAQEAGKSSLEQEIADVMCMCALLMQAGYITEDKLATGMKKKINKLKKYSSLVDLDKVV